MSIPQNVFVAISEVASSWLAGSLNLLAIRPVKVSFLGIFLPYRDIFIDLSKQMFTYYSMNYVEFPRWLEILETSGLDKESIAFHKSAIFHYLKWCKQKEELVTRESAERYL